MTGSPTPNRTNALPRDQAIAEIERVSGRPLYFAELYDRPEYECFPLKIRFTPVKLNSTHA